MGKKHPPCQTWNSSALCNTSFAVWQRDFSMDIPWASAHLSLGSENLDARARANCARP